ncbi:AMT1-1, partial [Symbiodinium microadriaticum]
MLRQLAEELSEQLDVARKQQRHSDASQTTTCPSDGGPSPEDFPEAQEEEPEEESDIHRPSIAKLSLPERMTPLQSPSNRSSELCGNPFDGLPVHQREPER